jgi:hypothetical protein
MCGMALRSEQFLREWRIGSLGLPLSDRMDRSGDYDMAPSRREGQGFNRQPLPKLRPAVHEMIGRRLRLHYEELQQQPLPDRLSELLEQLDDAADVPAPRQN